VRTSCAATKQDRHLAGFGIDLDIAELGREARGHAAGIDRGRGGDRAAAGVLWAVWLTSVPLLDLLSFWFNGTSNSDIVFRRVNKQEL